MAEWTDTTIDQIQALNPELRRWTTPAKDTDYQLKVPAGTAGIVASRLTNAPAAELASLKFYTVKHGDTLPLVARKLNVSRADLAEANDLKVTARVAAGQKLIVPREASVLMAARTERTVPAAEARPTVTHSGQLARAAATIAAAGSQRPGPKPPLKRRDALLEPIETAKCYCRNSADNRHDWPKGHRSVL